MTRKYRRDNLGRFAGGGGGATARGGRLRTATGKKRATKTMKASGPAMGGAVKGKVRRDLGAMAKAGKEAPSPQRLAPKTAKAPTKRKDGVLGGMRRDVILSDGNQRIRYRNTKGGGTLVESKVKAVDFGRGARRPGNTSRQMLNSRQTARDEIARRTKPRRNLRGETVPGMRQTRGYSRRITRNKGWDLSFGRK